VVGGKREREGPIGYIKLSHGRKEKRKYSGGEGRERQKRSTTRPNWEKRRGEKEESIFLFPVAERREGGKRGGDSETGGEGE